MITITSFYPDGFPHMNTEIIDPQKYKISEILGLSSFPNEGLALPFSWGVANENSL